MATLQNLLRPVRFSKLCGFFLPSLLTGRTVWVGGCCLQAVRLTTRRAVLKVLEKKKEVSLASAAVSVLEEISCKRAL